MRKVTALHNHDEGLGRPVNRVVRRRLSFFSSTVVSSTAISSMTFSSTAREPDTPEVGSRRIPTGLTTMSNSSAMTLYEDVDINFVKKLMV